MRLKSITYLISISFINSVFFSQPSFHRNDSLIVIKNSLPLQYPTLGGIDAGMFSTIDLNLDGTEDLVVFDKVDNKFLTFINNGLSSTVDYVYSPQYEGKFPLCNNWALLRDFNGDGKKDIFTRGSSADIRIFKNISSQVSGLSFELYLESARAYYGDPLLPIDTTDFFSIEVNSTDIPAIEDIDGDGDLDIISWNSLFLLDYYKNMAMERYGNTDTVDFLWKNGCWGKAYEISYPTYHKLGLNFDCLITPNNPQRSGGSRHAGGTVLTLDYNNDGVMDVLLGDAAVNNVVYAQNGGSAPNTNSPFVYQDTLFPSFNIPVNIKSMPGNYYLDVDNDGVKDLLVTPSETPNTENINSCWYYKNNGTNSLPQFSFQQNNFIQENTIDLGSGSMSTFFDYNKDGKKDLVVSSYGSYDKNLDVYISKLSLYENTGTITNPIFNYVSDNYQTLTNYNLGNAIYPAFKDLDNDGDEDLIVGNDSGRVHIFLDTSVGTIAQFKLVDRNLKDITNAIIDIGKFSTPQLFDYDKDGDYDLIVGAQNGLVRYYENVGTPQNFQFSFVTDTMGKIHIHDVYDTSGSVTTGMITPYFFEEQGETYMITGTYFGEVYLYGDVDSLNPNGAFTLLDTIVKRGEIGNELTTTAHDVELDGKYEMLIGNKRGGIAYFSKQKTASIAENKNHTNQFYVYPNPVMDELIISSNETYQEFHLSIYTLQGKLLHSINLTNINNKIDFTNYLKGLYFLEINHENKVSLHKVIKQ